MGFKRPEKKNRLKVLLFGTYGTGKTTAVLQAPNPVVYDLEEGTNHYSGISNFLVEDEKDPIKVIDSIEKLAKTPVIPLEDGTLYSAKTVGIDPIHMWELSLEQVLISRRRKEERNPNYIVQPQDYKALKFEKKRLMTRLLTVDLNVFVCARTKDIYAPGKMMEKIGIGPDCDDQWLGYFDTIVYIYFDPKQGNKRMAIAYGKDRTGFLPSEGGKFIPFEWSYENFAEYMKPLNFTSDSDATISQRSIDDQEGRHFETVYKGVKVRTAGVTGELLEQIASFYSTEESQTKFKKLLLEVVGVGEPYDLTEDMAKFLIEEMTK